MRDPGRTTTTKYSPRRTHDKMLGGKPASKHCNLCRVVCWKVNPPACGDCEHYNRIKQQAGIVRATRKGWIVEMDNGRYYVPERIVRDITVTDNLTEMCGALVSNADVIISYARGRYPGVKCMASY